ncbi:hypothetical protein [Crystallibacter crystallopoietes]|uniref:hypothetical protein n=1 Tax=Crystallibacter crystallopoietes TaxID=37928 RepID=UPI001ED99C22|nr:hypothetical protein [Arthrobacter crystallopoietes]
MGTYRLGDPDRDVAEVFDNSSARTPFRLCANYQQGALIGTPSWPKWAPGELRG